MSEVVRTPVQQRSIEKKNKIIRAGYQMFAEKGFFATNTSEIAKCAGVSTGIVYGYFRDKRDILLEVLEIYIFNAFSPVFEVFEKQTQPLDLERLMQEVIDSMILSHRENASMHEALQAISSTDKEVTDRFLLLEGEMTQKIAQKLAFIGYDKPHLTEKAHLLIQITQTFAHEFVFDHHEYIDYDAMRTFVVKMLLNLFE